MGSETDYRSQSERPWCWWGASTMRSAELFSRNRSTDATGSRSYAITLSTSIPRLGTADAGLLLVSYVYQQAFTFGNFGTAAAASVSVAPVLLALLWLCFAVPGKFQRA